MTSKDRILEVITHLPDDVSIDQAVERLYLLKKIEEGLRQADAGDVMSHEDFEREILGSEN